MRIGGIDEAGRGPVLGPMVIAGVAFPDELTPELEALGVKDSKALSPKKREKIAAALREIPGFDYYEDVIAPAEIDAAVFNRAMTLNGLTISRMAALIERLKPEEVYVDMVGTSRDRFAQSLHRLIDWRPRIVAEEKADAKYIATGAASVLAKTRRDAEIAAIDERFRDKYGPTGSGYPSDPKTVAFLAAARAEPGIFRTSWASFRRG